MKRVSYFILAAFFAVSSASFVSCTDDEDVEPASIKFDNVTNDVVTLAAGASTYTVNATITSVENLKSVKISKTVGSVTNQVGTEITSFPEKTSYHLTKEIDGITENCKITVTVNNGTETARALTINYTAGEAPAGDIDTWANKKLGSLAHGTTAGSSCASIDGTVYLLADAKTNSNKIDIIYFNGNEFKQSIAAPSNSAVQGLSSASTSNVSTWATKNATKLKKLSITATEFDAMDNDAVIDEKVTSATVNGDIASDLATDDVVGFITVAGKKGLIKIVSFDAENNATISIKVQK